MLYWGFYNYKSPYLFLIILPVLKFIFLSTIKTLILSFKWFMLKVHATQTTYSWVMLFIQFDNLCLLTAEFSPTFTFDLAEFRFAILLPVFYLCHLFTCLLVSPLGLSEKKALVLHFDFSLGFFKKALLKYNSHRIQFTHLNYNSMFCFVF